MSELFRMLQVLETRGYVTPADRGDGLVLTNKLFSLGMTRAPAKALMEAALPAMRRLADVIRQSIHLAIASGDQMVVVARIESPGDQGFSVRVGYRRGLVGVTSGLVLYAFQPERARREWASRLRPTVDPATWAAFEARAAQARADGHVCADSDVTRLVVDLSIPVIAPDGVAAALTCPYIVTPSSRSIPETLAEMRAAALDIARELGGAEPPPD